MTQQLATRPDSDLDLIESVVIKGDLKDLSVKDRVGYYAAVCRSLGLNPLTKPFEYLNLSGKLTLYAKKDCTDQLRTLRNISTRVIDRQLIDGMLVVTVEAAMPGGRRDEDIGVVSLEGLRGDAKANAMMKAATKARRRVTLAICGLGFFDAAEVEDEDTWFGEETRTARVSAPAHPADLYGEATRPALTAPGNGRTLARPMPQATAIPVNGGAKMTDAQRRELFGRVGLLEWKEEQLRAYVKLRFGLDHITGMSQEQAGAVITDLKNNAIDATDCYGPPPETDPDAVDDAPCPTCDGLAVNGVCPNCNPRPEQPELVIVPAEKSLKSRGA